MRQHDHEQPPTDTVTEFFAAIEADRWDEATSMLDDRVHIAHGPQGTTLPRHDLIANWKNGHAAFAHTTYRLEQCSTERTEHHRATVSCNAQIAMHPSADPDDEPQVTDGSYTIDTWQIDAIRHDEHPHHVPPATAD